VTGWLAASVGPELRTGIYMLTLFVRWALALGASVGVIALLYHLGVPDGRLRAPLGPIGFGDSDSRPWQTILPGAIMATGMWFLTTLCFGWYVTRFANYSEVYGSLGAGIALLFWLYIISLSVLCGAEFNAQVDAQWHSRRTEAALAPRKD